MDAGSAIFERTNTVSGGLLNDRSKLKRHNLLPTLQIPDGTSLEVLHYLPNPP